MAERYTTITWEEYARLQRAERILEWLDADFARKGVGLKLSEAIGEMLDAGLDMRQTLDRFARSIRPRPRRRPADRLGSHRADSDRSIERA